MSSSMTKDIKVKFSHIEMYVDHLEDVECYKTYEELLNSFHDEFGKFGSSSHSSRGDESESQPSQQQEGRESQNNGSNNVPLVPLSSNDILRGRRLWHSIQSDGSSSSDVDFAPHGRDVVKQLLAGFGFRVTGCYPGHPNANANADVKSVKSILVTSSDPNGIQVLVSSLNQSNVEEEMEGQEEGPSSGHYHHFDAGNIQRFYKSHSNRQGIAVLAFEVGDNSLEEIYGRYKDLHSALLPEEYVKGVQSYENEANVLEVYAYYRGEKGKEGTDDTSGELGTPVADEGTRLRFIEPIACQEKDVQDVGDVHVTKCKLPGIVPIPATFHAACNLPCYFDHWVSNVISRTGFLETLEDTLYFTPKVDFNAGVVAAGEAQIESTVTGNSATLSALSVLPTTEIAAKDAKEAALCDQSQIYLPINNALTSVGHVHGFLKEIGQGVQHIASRVQDIVGFVQRANDRRKMLGEGFTFLNIPRSYYGVLTTSQLVKGLPNTNNSESADCSASIISQECATAIFDICRAEKILHSDFSVDLNMAEKEITSILDSNVPSVNKDEYTQHKGDTVKTILRSRYVNLYNLLRDHLSEESYVAIVRNQILVDVQGEDLLYQIFTSNILQRKSVEEAPFFEFIQRVCSECVGPDGCPKQVKPGCGGFGIRNFLTLFLSIEVTKAMLEASHAKDAGDEALRQFAQRKVDIFTDQLNESNPILTEISDAMTREGIARDEIAVASAMGDEERAEKWKVVMEKEAQLKAESNLKLMACNVKYQHLMKELRESQESMN